jgi:2,3-bisphosphoglycerate-independent phosphoglycerate mutase
MAEAVLARNGSMIVTADHGNCEQMWDDAAHSPHTAHTTNLVPVILVGATEGTKLRDGRLADLAPTLLDLMGLDRPAAMTGRPLYLSDDR